MATKKAKTKAHHATQGYGYYFHGAFSTRARANVKAAQVRKRGDSAWVVSRKMRGVGLRYVVMSPGVPF